ncbi:cobyric acid synthase [Pseudooceanicola nanhaiensis]|uniref:cobyric acid synthase n=1 Tax=Pseudooceanicola nanhaiensis TaxID=375761 RepID=UPI001CD41987|nr:cobyric acid synthase [Pseudooceanicola nanhaiensis]MCA0921995.1 cobyric acid synthase [Pseudooceanicola nanhaiensis]
MARALMIQGTGSNAGKSMIVAGLARAFANRGLRVRPFKPQNMSNNAAVTPEGGEIGRAQALQARAARVASHVDMNPVLLKPESETGAQIILHGKRLAQWEARDFTGKRQSLLPQVLDSFHRLAAGADLVLVEGAGSPAEVNLRAGDIANMGFARAADVPVILLGDIDRGGVIAQLVGTQVVLEPGDSAMIAGFAVNKFRGDPRLFEDGVRIVETATRWPSLGVIPWFDAAWRLPAEDVLDLAQRPGGPVRIAVPCLPRIANFDDLDPLVAEPEVEVQLIRRGRPLPGDAALVLIPGSKSTIADLAAFRAEGWDIDLAAHVRRGGHVLGLCGGYQMLGRRISDPEGLEGAPAQVEGLGLLDVETILRPAKRLGLVEAHHPESGSELTGYEIHLGETTGADAERPWLTVAGLPEGASSDTGQVRGSYLHGLFAADGFRAAYLAGIGAASRTGYDAGVEDTLEALAAHLEAHLDLDRLLDLAREVGPL